MLVAARGVPITLVAPQVRYFVRLAAFLNGEMQKMLMNIRHVGFAVAALATAVLAAPLQANLLSNEGFEDPISADGPPFVGSWETFSLDSDQDGGPDVARNDTSMPRTGAQALELAIMNVPNSFAGIFQDVPSLSAGQVATFSGWNKSLGDDGGIEIRIEWRDSVSDVEIGRTPNFTPMPGSEYELFSLTDVVPAGADTARAVYAIQSFGGALNQQVFVDDTSFSVVPEPSSACLIGLATLALTAVYRRRC